MISHVNATRDVAGNNLFGLPFSKFLFNSTLSIGAEQTLDIPGDTAKWLAIFSYQPGSSVWVANNETAASAGGSFASTDSELNPVAREVKAGDQLHFITPDTSVLIGVSLHAI